MLATDGRHVRGWLTNQNALRALARQLAAAQPEITAGQRAAEWADPHAGQGEHDRNTQLAGYRIVEHLLGADSPAAGRALAELDLPVDHLPVSVLQRDRRLVDADPRLRLAAGDRVNVLVPHHHAGPGEAGPALDAVASGGEPG